jgi:hypothetical protein
VSRVKLPSALEDKKPIPFTADGTIDVNVFATAAPDKQVKK